MKSPRNVDQVDLGFSGFLGQIGLLGFLFVRPFSGLPGPSGPSGPAHHNVSILPLAPNLQSSLLFQLLNRIVNIHHVTVELHSYRSHSLQKVGRFRPIQAFSGRFQAHNQHFPDIQHSRRRSNNGNCLSVWKCLNRNPIPVTSIRESEKIDNRFLGYCSLTFLVALRLSRAEKWALPWRLR